MESAIFAVNDEPYCLWEDSVAQRTRDFLSGLDTEFFDYLLKVHSEADDEKRASVGIRLALHHATETLFSLLGAFVQAPHCPYAWIARCQTEALREVVQRIGSGDASLITTWAMPFADWTAVAESVFRTFEPGTEKQGRVVGGHGKAWAGLAGELCSEVINEEYNAIKHGFRAQPGGFRLEFGPAAVEGTPITEVPMQLLGESKYGSMFFKIERFKGKGGRQLRSRRTSVNWSIERDLLLLRLCQSSINNVISALKVENGFAPSECLFQYPQDDDDFVRPWKYSTGVTSMNFDFSLDERQLPEISKADILSKLRRQGS